MTFSEEYYDFSEKLVSFEFAPRSHSPPAIFFRLLDISTPKLFNLELFYPNIFNPRLFNHKLYNHLANPDFSIMNFSTPCTLSAKDLGATKNPAVDLELILVHHFSRILCVDASSVLSTALNSLVTGLTSLKIWLTKSAKKRHLCASISAHSLQSACCLL